MSQDPMDRQLVEAVLAATPRRRRAAAAEVKAVNAASKAAGAVAVIDEEAEDDELDLGSDPDVPELVVAEEDLVGASMDGTGEASADAAAPDVPAKLDPKVLEEPTAEELEALSADMIGIDDPVRMYLQGDREGGPPDRRGGDRPGQGDRARRVDGGVPRQGDDQPPRVDAARHRAQDAHRQAAAPAPAGR